MGKRKTLKAAFGRAVLRVSAWCFGSAFTLWAMDRAVMVTDDKLAFVGLCLLIVGGVALLADAEW